MINNFYKFLTFDYLIYKFNKLFCNKFSDINLSKIYKDFDSKYIKNGANLDHIDEKSLNLNYYDQQIEEFIVKKSENKNLYNINQNPENDKISILFTEIYSTGGHTALIERLTESFKDEYKLKLFATRLNFCKYGSYSKKQQNNILKNCNIDGVNSFWNDPILERYVFKLYHKIISYNPKMIFCYINPCDVVLVAILALLKKYSKIKIIDINMQDHFYSLGFKFADLIIDFRPAGQNITRKIRGYKNTILAPLQQLKKEETKYLSKKEILELRKNIGLNKDQYFILSGGSSYKYFNGNDSDYFKFIKDLLKSETKIMHVIISNFSDKFCNIIQNIFQDNLNLLDRVKIIPLTSNFDPYMQSCDLFIDSFPQGAALTHIDLMRNKKPTIVKINKHNPIRSFEYYLPKDYPYAYDNLKDMKEGILKLLQDKKLRDELSQDLYKYYLAKYEFHIVKEKYKKLIDNSNNLEKFYGTSFY